MTPEQINNFFDQSDMPERTSELPQHPKPPRTRPFSVPPLTGKGFALEPKKAMRILNNLKLPNLQLRTHLI